MSERKYRPCVFCWGPSEGLHGITTSVGGQEPPKPACRSCAQGDVDAMVAMNLIRNARFYRWEELEQSHAIPIEEYLAQD
jgi:hypothetical protein